MKTPSSRGFASVSAASLAHWADVPPRVVRESHWSFNESLKTRAKNPRSKITTQSRLELLASCGITLTSEQIKAIASL